MKAKAPKRWMGNPQRLLAICGASLATSLLLGLLWEYRHYFPADFERSDFLAGRRHRFGALYAAAFYTHIVCGPMCMLGCAATYLPQRLRWFSECSLRRLAWHRRIGKVVAVLVIIGLVPSGLVLAHSAYGGPAARCGFAFSGILTAWITIAMAIAASRGHLDEHARWADRFAALVLISPLFFRATAAVIRQLDLDESRWYAWNAWSSWAMPLLFVELQRRVVGRGFCGASFFRAFRHRWSMAVGTWTTALAIIFFAGCSEPSGIHAVDASSAPELEQRTDAEYQERMRIDGEGQPE